MGLTVASLRFAVERNAASLETGAARLNALDGQLGDGDLGITMEKAFRAMQAVAPDLPQELGPALNKCAGVVAKASSSSFGTLFATALMTAAKQIGAEKEWPWPRMAEVLSAVLDKLMARGGASLGDKTVLDALAATIEAVSAAPDDADQMLAAARARVAAALETFRAQPNKVGRARIFGERSIGLDDPGMVAFAGMLDALA